ncbi:MAG: redox-regulated ATPase YchF, partial [Candidatus Cloacimonetes bacterium]|nr:redox-regulated ATPase YchF [Candidatus Cloacimonadota bacterium]
RGIKDNLLLLEEQCLLKAELFLNSAKPLRDLELSQEEEKVLRGFKFLTQKPVMLILNSDESSFSVKKELLSQLSQKASILEFAGKFELELTNLSPEDAAEFMKDMGIEDSARNRLVKFSYDLLGYISFFTVGKDEVRAWTIEKNRTAVEAAGKIHSDLERGFIRAECYNYEDIFQHKSEKKLRETGLIRLEGKNYLVQDGDILNIRFNV